MGNICVAKPSEALIISGGCAGGAAQKKRIVGGWGWAWWCVTDVQRLSLEVMTLEPQCDCETKQGVPLTVTAAAQVKVMKEPEMLKVATEQFLGKKVSEISDTILESLEGHLRAILATLTVEEIYQDREKFAGEVSYHLKLVCAIQFSKSKTDFFGFQNFPVIK